jgi:hypothetical protein
MALVYQDGKPYLYRSVRRGGKVTSEYRLCGPLAVAVAALEARERQAEAAARRAERAERDRLDDLERVLDRRIAGAQALARDVLERAGYHQHRRGEWRRRREGSAVAIQQRRKRTVLEAPDGRIMDRWVDDQLLDLMAGADGEDETRETLRREIASVAAELAGPDPSPVEAILARSAALAWVFLRWQEVQYAAILPSPEASMARVEHRDRRLDRAFRRHLATLKMLAVVRRLALPALQVNLARNQVNVAGALPDGSGGRNTSPPAL